MACCVTAVTAPIAIPAANNLSRVCDDDKIMIYILLLSEIEGDDMSFETMIKGCTIKFISQLCV